MTPAVFLSGIVDPTLKMLSIWPFIEIPFTDEGRVLCLTICGQESRWKDRLQIGGRARGYSQFERFGGVARVFQRMSRQLAAVCGMLDITLDPDTVFEAMAWNDTLMMSMTRFNLYPDPAPLPRPGDEEGAWEYYNRIWAPGMPDRQRWSEVYPVSLALVKP